MPLDPRLILHHQLHCDLSVKKAKEAALIFLRKRLFVPVSRFYVLFVFYYFVANLKHFWYKNSNSLIHPKLEQLVQKFTIYAIREGAKSRIKINLAVME